jgi:hypothetical protein
MSKCTFVFAARNRQTDPRAMTLTAADPQNWWSVADVRAYVSGGRD